MAELTCNPYAYLPCRWNLQSLIDAGCGSDGPRQRRDVWHFVSGQRVRQKQLRAGNVGPKRVEQRIIRIDRDDPVDKDVVDNQSRPDVIVVLIVVEPETAPEEGSLVIVEWCPGNAEPGRDIVQVLVEGLQTFIDSDE